jgi:hypothetical protein
MARWKNRLRNSSLWRTSAIFWLLNAVGNAVTAGVANTPSVYFALSGINMALAGLSWFVSRQYRLTEQLQRQFRVEPGDLPPVKIQPLGQTDEQVHSV